MGTWGTSIDENDTYNDIQRDFLDLYNQGNPLDEIYSEFLSDEDFEEIPEESHDFWFAIADLLWQCKGLNDKVFKVVQDIIESKSDLNYWKETNGNDEDIKERENELNKFLEKISTQKKRAKRRVKKKLFDSLFNKGDVITFKLTNNNYGLALVIDDENGIKTESGKNLIVISDFESIDRPTIKEVKKANVKYFVMDYEPVKPRVAIGDFGKMSWEFFPEKRIDIETIGNLKVKTLGFSYNSMAFMWNHLQLWSGKDKNEIQVSNRLKLKDFIIVENVEIKLSDIIKIIGFIVIIILGIIKILGIKN